MFLQRVSACLKEHWLPSNCDLELANIVFSILFLFGFMLKTML